MKTNFCLVIIALLFLSGTSHAQELYHNGDFVLVQDSAGDLTKATLIGIGPDSVFLQDKPERVAIHRIVPYQAVATAKNCDGLTIQRADQVLVLGLDFEATLSTVEDIANNRLKMVGRPVYYNPCVVVPYVPQEKLVIGHKMELKAGMQVTYFGKQVTIEDIANFMVKTSGSKYVDPNHLTFYP